HPAERFAEVLKVRGWGNGRIGIEGDAYYMTPKLDGVLRQGLPKAEIIDAGLLVSWVRAVKSAAEIGYMQQAAQIAEGAMRVAIHAIGAGVRECDADGEGGVARRRGSHEF